MLASKLVARFSSFFLLLTIFFQTSQANLRLIPSGISSSPTSDKRKEIGDYSLYKMPYSSQNVSFPQVESLLIDPLVFFRKSFQFRLL